LGSHIEQRIFCIKNVQRSTLLQPYKTATKQQNVF